MYIVKCDLIASRSLRFHPRGSASAFGATGVYGMGCAAGTRDAPEKACNSRTRKNDASW
jgi:hypothetical protein